MEHLRTTTPKSGELPRRGPLVGWFAQHPSGKHTLNSKTLPLRPATGITKLLKARMLARSRVSCGPSWTKASLKLQTLPNVTGAGSSPRKGAGNV